MPYDPNTSPDSEIDPLTYPSRSDGYEGGDTSKSMSRGWEISNEVNGTNPAQAARREELSDSDDPGSEAYEDAQSGFGINEEVGDDEVDLLPADVPWESVEAPALQETPKPKPLNGLTPIPSAQSPAKHTQVAVVLNPTPRKEAYRAFNSDELNEGGEQDDLDPIVTSDLLPGPKRIKASIVSPKADLKRKEPDSAPGLAPPKKRGRPVGWKPGDGSYSNKPPGTKVKKPPGEAKRRGRPPRVSPAPRDIYLNSTSSKFNDFCCEWEGCPARLQNLDTFRRHLLIVHGNIKENGKKQTQPTPSTCKWGRCPSKNPCLVLNSPEEFVQHVQRHINTQALHMGDGPKNSTDLEYSDLKLPVPASRGDANPPPRYLFDEDGNQVTPAIPAELEIESAEEREQRLLRLKRVLRKQQDNAPPETEYTRAQAREITKELTTKMKVKEMYQEYYDAVVERPKQQQQQKRKKKPKKDGDGPAGEGSGAGDNFDSLQTMESESLNLGTTYGLEWKGNLTEF